MSGEKKYLLDTNAIIAILADKITFTGSLALILLLLFR